jgi:hypothetical protein
MCGVVNSVDYFRCLVIIRRVSVLTQDEEKTVYGLKLPNSHSFDPKTTLILAYTNCSNLVQGKDANITAIFSSLENK